MKSHAVPPLEGCRPLTRPLLVSLALLLGQTQLAPPARAQEEQLDVGVRSSVIDMTYLWSHQKPKMPGEGGHGKIYGILSVDEVKSNDRLVKPVDRSHLVSLFMDALDANGFKQFTKGQKPDILLTLSFGRGELANPYIRDQGEVGGMGNPPAPGVGSENGGSGSGPQAATAPQLSITGGMALQLYDEKTPGYEAKLQKASFEKLYLRVTAWAYPTANAKPRMLWKSIMVVDDPDHRDLNAVAAKMLEAGAPYFDKQPKDKEIDVYKPLMETHVNVGPPEVVEPKK